MSGYVGSNRTKSSRFSSQLFIRLLRWHGRMFLLSKWWRVRHRRASAMLRASLQLPGTGGVLLVHPTIGTQLSKVTLAVFVVPSAGNTCAHLARATSIYFAVMKARHARLRITRRFRGDGRKRRRRKCRASLPRTPCAAGRCPGIVSMSLNGRVRTRGRG